MRHNSEELDTTCRGMDILTLVIVMGQGVADIVVFGGSLPYLFSYARHCVADLERRFD